MAPEDRIKILEHQVRRILPLASLPKDITWEERLVRIETTVQELVEQVEGQNKGFGMRLTDFRRRYDATMATVLRKLEELERARP
jgi:hypothetical protein